MSEPWENGGLDEMDFVEGFDDEDDELGIDYHGSPEPEDTEDMPELAPTPLPTAAPARELRRPAPRVPRTAPLQRAGRKFRIRAMSPKMAARARGAVSILITKSDGSQVLFVRKGS